MNRFTKDKYGCNDSAENVICRIGLSNFITYSIIKKGSV